jgi:hypothetical protein
MKAITAAAPMMILGIVRRERLTPSGTLRQDPTAEELAGSIRT